MKAIHTLLVLAMMLGTSLLASACCEPYYTYNIEDGTWVFDNLTECEGGIYCWYVDGVLQVIDPEFSWTPAEPGDYEICLNIAYEGCSNWYCEDLEVSEEDCSPCHLTVNAHDCGDCIFLFSTEYDFEGDITWLLSDGTTASGDVLLHTFAGPGTYTVCAMATTDLCGSISECFTVTTDCEGGEPLCEGGNIQVNPYGDCVWEMTATDLPEGAELSWTLNDGWWGNDLTSYYTAFGEETVLVELFITSPACPDGYLLSTSFVTETCTTCDQQVSVEYENLESCSAGLYVVDDLLSGQEWYVNGEYYSGQSYIEIQNNTGALQVYEITVYPYIEGCPDAAPITEILTLEPCAFDCGPYELIANQDVDECWVQLEIPGTDTEIVVWYVNDQVYTTTGGSLWLDADGLAPGVTVTAQFELFGCGLISVDAFVPITDCGQPCDQQVSVEYENLESCSAGLYVVDDLLSGQEWYVNGEYYSGQSYIEIQNNTGALQVYEITVYPYIEGCPDAAPITEILTLEPCAFDCGPYELIANQDVDECWVQLEIPGTDTEIVVWYVNDQVYTTTGGSLWLDADGLAPGVTVTAQFELFGCGLISVDAFVPITDCGQPCDESFELYFTQDGCAGYVEIPGLPEDVEVFWSVNESTYTTQGGVLQADLSDVPDVMTATASFALPGCDEAFLSSTFTVISPCGVDCEIWASYEACDTDVWLFGYGTGSVDWFIEGEYVGSGEQVDWQAPGPGVYEVCACLESATCGGTCECFPVEIGDCPAPDYQTFLDGDVLHVEVSTDLDNLQWTFYGNGVYETYTGSAPDAFYIDGPGDYTLCVWNLDCPNDCGDCSTITVTEPLVALSAWPNPAAAGTGVTVEITTDNATLLTLRDMHGREIDRISHPNPREFIATAELPSGIYLLELQTPGGRETLRLFVQR